MQSVRLQTEGSRSRTNVFGYVFDLSSLALDKRALYVVFIDIRASQGIRSKEPMSCLGAGHIGQKR